MINKAPYKLIVKSTDEDFVIENLSKDKATSKMKEECKWESTLTATVVDSRDYVVDSLPGDFA